MIPFIAAGYAYDHPEIEVGARFAQIENTGYDVLSFHQEAAVFNRGARWTTHIDLPRLSLGIGLAYLESSRLNSRLNFALAAESSLSDAWSVSFRHYSNANFTNQRGNYGLNVVSIRYTR